MAGPWEQYQSTPTAVDPSSASGPWQKYAQSKTQDSPKEPERIALPFPLPGGHMPTFQVNKNGPFDYTSKDSIPGKIGGYYDSIMRGIPQGALAKLTGLANAKDLENLTSGNATTGKEYATRAGVSPTSASEAFPQAFSTPENPNFLLPSKGGIADVSPAGLVGGAADIGTQMLSGTALSKLARAAFNVPFWKQDAKLIQKDKLPLSPMAWNSGQNPSSAGGVTDMIEGLIPTKTGERDAMEAPIFEANPRGKMASAMEDGQAFADKMKNSGDPGEQQLGARLQKQIDMRLAQGEKAAVPPIPATQTQVPSSILDQSGNPMTTSQEIPGTEGVPEQQGPTYKALRDIQKAAWNNRQKDLTTNQSKFWNGIGAGSANEATNVANQVIPGAGEAIRNKNAEISSLLQSLPEAQRAELAEQGKLPITQFDAASLVMDPTGALTAGKNVGKYLGRPAAWTTGGRYGNVLGEGSAVTAPFSPWVKMLQDQNKGQ